jgi:hypothetical protein
LSPAKLLRKLPARFPGRLKLPSKVRLIGGVGWHYIIILWHIQLLQYLENYIHHIISPLFIYYLDMQRSIGILDAIALPKSKVFNDTNTIVPGRRVRHLDMIERLLVPDKEAGKASLSRKSAASLLRFA